MKHVLAALLSLTLSGCEAQQVLRAPVNVATTLYKDCVEVSFVSLEIEPTRVAILNLVQEVDERCYAWTSIWYKPFFGSELVEAPNDVHERFTANRIFIRKALKDQLLKEALR